MAEVILDLSTYKRETADIRLEDGRVLHLEKPSEALMIELLQLRSVDVNTPGAELLRALDATVAAILNNNADGYDFPTDVVARLPLDQKTAIIAAYTEFATKLQSNPTISSPSNPETKPTARWSLRRWFTRSPSTRE